MERRRHPITVGVEREATGETGRVAGQADPRVPAVRAGMQHSVHDLRSSEDGFSAPLSSFFGRAVTPPFSEVILGYLGVLAGKEGCRSAVRKAQPNPGVRRVRS